MREAIEQSYSCRVIDFANFDGECEHYSALTTEGDYILADSLALLISALQDRYARPMMLAA